MVDKVYQIQVTWTLTGNDSDANITEWDETERR